MILKPTDKPSARNTDDEGLVFTDLRHTTSAIARVSMIAAQKER